MKNKNRRFLAFADRQTRKTKTRRTYQTRTLFPETITSFTSFDKSRWLLTKTTLRLSESAIFENIDVFRQLYGNNRVGFENFESNVHTQVHASDEGLNNYTVSCSQDIKHLVG